MKKEKIIRYLILAALVIGMIGSTILAVYTFKVWKNDGTFVFEHMMYFIGSAALDLTCFIASFAIIIKLLGGDSNGKNR